jgi:hypothetical protein
MTRVVRNAALLCVAGILVASAALANVPDPAKSSLQSSYIAVEGQTGGQPDNCSDGRCANFTVTVRDFANNVIAGSTVVVDFSGCSDIQIACSQLNAVTGQSYLAGKKVSGTTNASGQFIFKVQGASNAAPTAGNTTTAGTNAGVPCAQVYADGVPLTPSLIVAAYDVNGSGAVSSADASLVTAEGLKIALGAQARARDDYNNSNSVTSADASIATSMGLQAGLGTGSQITGPYCP